MRAELTWLGGAICLTAVIWFGVVDYSVLPPSVAQWIAKNSAPVGPMHETAALQHPDNPLRNFYAAETKTFDPQHAAEFYDRALQTLDKTRDQPKAKALLLIVQYNAAKNEVRLHHYPAAEKLLEKNIAGMNALAETFAAKDPFVLGGFGLLIQEREKLLRDVRTFGEAAPGSDQK